MPDLAHFLAHDERRQRRRRSPSRRSSAASSRSSVGLPLMRLSGLAAGIATFAVLEITNNVLTY